MSEDAKRILRLAKKARVKEEPKAVELLSSGSTLLNLACTNNPFGAFPKGRYVLVVGDSTSGKTLLCLTCFAEAFHSPSFQDYRLIYDDTEGGCLIDIPRLFGEDVARKIKPPEVDGRGEPVYSATIEEFYYHIDDAIQEAKKPGGSPFVYVLDSMDGMSSEAEQEKFGQQKEAHRSGKAVPGSYGDGKAKRNSAGMRVVTNGLRETSSILIVLSQTRDPVGQLGYERKTRSGGHALRFYATLEIWTSLAGSIKKKIRGRDRKVGVHAKAVLRKNRYTGLLNDEIMLDLYPSYGIDDVGSCVDFLVGEGWWPKVKQSIEAKEFEILCSRDKLITHIEEQGLSRKLQQITGRCWREIQEALSLGRTRRYQDVGSD